LCAGIRCVHAATPDVANDGPVEELPMNLLSRVVILFAFAASLKAQSPPKPGVEHQRLTAQSGVWDARIQTLGEDGKMVECKGVSRVKAGPGGLWVIDEFEADMMGAPFAGHGTTGFDPATGKHVGTWIDSWSPTVMHLEGSVDKTGKVLTMTGMGPGPDGKPVLHTMVTTAKDDGSRVFEMSTPGPDGKPTVVMTIVYTRQPAKK
jgi:hypothetical protein